VPHIMTRQRDLCIRRSGSLQLHRGPGASASGAGAPGVTATTAPPSQRPAADPDHQALET
jgi:hypothetical protein